MTNTTKKNNRRREKIYRLIVAMTMTLAFIGAGLIGHKSYVKADTPSAPAGPAIALQVNYYGTVISCSAVNEVGVAVLSGMDGGNDLAGVKMDVAVNAIAGALLQSGYTGDIASAVLITIGNGTQGSAAYPPAAPGSQAGVVTDIGADAVKAIALNHAGLSEGQISGLLVERDWDDGRLEYEVKFFYNNTEYEYTIDGSTGAIYTYEKEPVKEREKESQPKQEASSGNASSDIGTGGAKAAALSHAGLSEGDIRELEIERDWDDGILEYEVSFMSGGYEYEYDINGTTGAVLKHSKEWDD